MTIPSQQSPLISVIVPVYRVAEYLVQCVASIVEQTYRNLEIILVDDGSPDECPALCDAWQERDDRIKVIHQANGGLSRARNAGMVLATGEFIGFVDSDDWLEPDMYEKLMQALMETGADLAACRFFSETESSPPQRLSNGIPENPTLFPTEDALKGLLCWDKRLCSYVWNKLYRRSLINGIEFIENQPFEDILWTTRVIGSATSCAVLDARLCHYRFRADSLAHGDMRKYFGEQGIFEAWDQRLQYIRQSHPALNELAIGQYQVFCCARYLELGVRFANVDPDGNFRQRMHQRARRWSWRTILRARHSRLKKGGALLFYFFPKGFLFAIKMFSPLLRPMLYALKKKGGIPFSCHRDFPIKIMVTGGHETHERKLP